MMTRVLTVDDSKTMRDMLAVTLRTAGYDVLQAENGQEGLDSIRSLHPGLVLLDVMMPTMNGYDVCKAVRENPEFDDVKIILLTAKGQEADRERGINVGATQYLTKPFDPDELLNIAKEMLRLTE